MSFDRRQAEATLVEILDGPTGERVVGMGFRVLDDVVATACHCLPRVQGRVVLPDPEDPSPDPIVVRVRRRNAMGTALAAVRSVDPCSDLALLGAPEKEASPLPAGTAPWAEVIAGREHAAVEFAPQNGQVFVYTHEGRWVEGTARSSSIMIWRPSDRIRGATSGAPVFNELGRVVGLVGNNDIRLPEVAMCVLADWLPGWALRRAREEESARSPGVPPAS